MRVAQAMKVMKAPGARMRRPAAAKAKAQAKGPIVATKRPAMAVPTRAAGQMMEAEQELQVLQGADMGSGPTLLRMSAQSWSC